MTILVTGASGHLGTNLVRRLLDDGHSVRVLLREGSNNAAVDGLDLDKVYGDLRDFTRVKAVVKGCNRIYHCAAKVSTLDSNSILEREIYDCNVLGTIHILQAALECDVSKVVVSGSFSAVGHNPEKPSDETIPFYPFSPHLPYGFSKTFVEHECLKAFANGLNVVVAVSCAILGPHDYKPSRMGRTLIDFANGKLPAYVPGGFEFVAARDIVEGHILAMSKGRPGQKYIFSSQFLTVDDLMDIFEEVTNRDRPPLKIPGAMMAGIAKVADFILPRFFPNVPRRFTSGAVRILRMHRHADISKAKNELGYQPTSIKASIQSAYDDFLRRGLITPVGKRIAFTRPKENLS
ncbi:NAD-dependent epimerase/dehydratase family protein [Calothrix rhizosoleniae]|uniref:NAD-dependent epimerase/dehydratase family protein n=1 Tax=Calothrix rhizosoleniae TaxID=888997 RepID=UPI000B4A3B34|nr:NAD-dependent epimerase/dehydratase family protein [Calothrix rhizosoleniae]